MPHRRAILALLLTLAVSPVFATAEHKYAKGEYAIILGGKAPNGKLSIAAHGEGDAGSENFRLSLMAEPAHRKLMTLDNVNDDNILDSAPDAFHAAWSADSRIVAVSFRSERHVVTLNIYAVDGRLAKLLESPDLFRDDDGSVFETDIGRVAAAGLTGGKGYLSFDPTGRVTRDQMGSFLARTLDLFVASGAQLPSKL